MKLPEAEFFEGKPCGICGHRMLSLEHANVDHIVPVSRGGGDETENLQFTHKWCNHYKGDRLPGEYKKPSFAWNLKCLALYKLGILRF